MPPYKAFLFDLNGTMINDMHYHVQAWHTVLNNLGAGLTLHQTKLQSYGKNTELLERIFPGRFTHEEKTDISYKKEMQYQHDFRPHLKLIDGLNEFLQKAYKAEMPMAIGSAANYYNVEYALQGCNIQHLFPVVVASEHVSHSKPHPETFLLCAKQLNISPANCLVFEDSPKGVEAAANAGMDCLVLTTLHTAEEFVEYKNIIGCISDYNDPLINILISDPPSSVKN
jgi:beta-phosphoglucomutase